jgi:hypothetical protein
MSALAAQSATIPITTVPYTISSPGTYVLTGNLTSPPLQNQSAILITGSAGTVVLDLKGFTLMMGVAYPNFAYTGINIRKSNVTVRNGTILNFNNGINVAPPGSGYLSNVLVQNVTFNNLDGTHIDFIAVNSSVITNCTFIGFAQAAIYDHGSQTANRFSENRFDGNQRAILSVLFLGGPVVLEQCSFDAQ